MSCMRIDLVGTVGMGRGCEGDEAVRIRSFHSNLFVSNVKLVNYVQCGELKLYFSPSAGG